MKFTRMMKQTRIQQRWIYVVALLAAMAVTTVALLADKLAVKDLMTPVLSLFATFFGATFAFRLNEEKERRLEEKSRRAILNRALYVLLRQANAIAQIQKDFEAHPTAFDRAFNLPAIKPPTYDDLKHDFADLDFLLESSSSAQLLLELSIEQERFHQALESLKVRNDFFIAEVQPALSNLGLKGRSITNSEALSMLGERVFSGARQGADNAFEHVSECNKSLPEKIYALHQYAKSLFPQHKFLSIGANDSKQSDSSR